MPISMHRRVPAAVMIPFSVCVVCVCVCVCVFWGWWWCGGVVSSTRLRSCAACVVQLRGIRLLSAPDRLNGLNADRCLFDCVLRRPLRRPLSRQHPQPRWFHILPGRNSETNPKEEHCTRCLEDACKRSLWVHFGSAVGCGCGCGCGRHTCTCGCGCATLRIRLWTGADQAMGQAETKAGSSFPHCRTWSSMF